MHSNGSLLVTVADTDSDSEFEICLCNQHVPSHRTNMFPSPPTVHQTKRVRLDISNM